MAKKNTLTNLLAIVGTILVWFPVLAPFLLGTASLFMDQIFRFDYLMPAELFPVALLGGLLSLWAALRARARRRWIGWSLALGVVMLFSGQGIAVASGLANGDIEPQGFWFATVIASLLLYSLSLVSIGIGDGYLLGDLFRQPKDVTPA